MMEEAAGVGIVHGGGKEVAVEVYGHSSEDSFGHNALADHQM